VSQLDTINLLVATLDLQLIKLLRDAIRTADIHGAAASKSGRPGDSFEPRRHLQPEAQILPRQRFHPTPRIEPRQVIHPAPIIRQPVAMAACEPPPALPEPDPPLQHHCCASCSPIQPPWKVLHWQNPPAPRPVVKVVLRRPDIVHRGAMIDFFI
jgi:hypothetical protein